MNAKYLFGGSFVTGAHPVLSTGTTSSYSTAAILTFSVNGFRGTPLAAQTNAASPTVDFATNAPITLGPSQSRCVVWAINQAGTVACFAGPVVDYTNAVYTVPPQFPPIPDTHVPFAYQLLRTAANSGTITFGSTAWNATGYTNVIGNVYVLPDRPQVS